MCGIGGYVDFGKGRAERPVLEGMVRALRRRGPDAQGVLLDGACGLAHTRLSIIDIAGSPQPMRVGGSNVSLVYNGELYNYQSLRARLCQEGEQFSSSGDTEVVLRMVGKQWEMALAQFDGMFAFGAWDRVRESLLLARDPIGEKPLFYATPRPGLLVFGSEIKAVLMHPEVNGDIDLAGLQQVLRFRAVYGDGSLYRGVRQLEPGTFLEFGRGGMRQGRFHDLMAEVAREVGRQQSLSDEHLILEGDELLRESVRERLIADAPVGAFLSGGLDSSLIVAHMRRMRAPGERVQTFAVGFAEDAYSELPFARQVADAVGTQHTAVSVTQDQYIDRLSELTYCRDAPLSEPADVAIAEMSRVARQSVKVVLSGEGADEVFAGYPKYHFADAPRLLRAAIRGIGPARFASIAGMLGFDRRRSLVAARALAPRGDLERMVQWFSYLDRETLKLLFPGLLWADAEWNRTTENQEAAATRIPQCSALTRMQIVDCLTWLPGNLLQRGDRMTMAEGLELRPPFLDRELVAFGLALPDRLKIHSRMGKHVVRRWADGAIPSPIRRRRKWGFRVPLAQWFRGSMKAMLNDYLLARDGLSGTYGDRHQVRHMLKEHDAGNADLNLPLWTLLTAEIWYQDVYGKRREKTKGTTLADVAVSAAGSSAVGGVAGVSGQWRCRQAISVIIPAHNEESVIGRCLEALTANAESGELEVIVVCNGCTDQTAAVARGFGQGVVVRETEVPSKTHALNLGDSAATHWPRVYLDADIVLPLESLRRMAETLRGPDRVLAAAPAARFDASKSSSIVKAFYRVWSELPYVRSGMIGSGIYAVSEEGRKRFGEFPEIIADDAFVRLAFDANERRIVDDCEFVVTVPKTLWSLVKIKTRSHLGNVELRMKFPDCPTNEWIGQAAALAKLARDPRRWVDISVYVLVNVATRCRVLLQSRRRQFSNWERDETSREGVAAKPTCPTGGR